MRKIYFLFAFVLSISWQLEAQVFIDESLDSGLPSGWTQSGYFSNTTNSDWRCEGSGAMVDNLYSSSANGNITSPNYASASNGTDVTVEFQWRSFPYTTNDVDYIMYVEYSTDDGTNWNLISTFAVTETNACTTYSQTIPAANVPNGSDFKFQVRGEWQSGDAYFSLDDVNISQVLSCPQPTNLQVMNITSTSADLSWTIGDSESDWEYVVQTAGTGVPASGDSTQSNSFTEMDLTPGTNYEVYVRADCTGGDYSIWVGPVAFATDCAVLTSFDENFDSTTTPNLPNCWAGITDGGASSSAVVQTNTSADNSAPNGVRLYNASSSSTSNIILVSPELSNLNAATHRLRFMARNTTTSQDIEVGTITDPTDGSTFTSLESVDINSTYTEYIVDYSSYTGTDNYIAIRRLSTSTYTNVYLDDIKWEEIPSCLEVADIAVDNITDVTAEISWTVSGSNEMDWEYMVQAPGTGTPTGNGMATSDNPVTAMGLTPETDYEVYVRADCDGNGYGAWIGPVTFSTIETCPDPSGLTVTNITDTSVDLGWNENGMATVWNIEWGIDGFTQGMGTTIMGTTTNPHNLTGLTAVTEYDFYVQANCGGGELSDWIGPYSFTTDIQTAFTCGDDFIDEGGASNNYEHNSDITYTFTPDTAGEVVSINFTAFETEGAGMDNCYDELIIYNGPDTSSPQITPADLGGTGTHTGFCYESATDGSFNLAGHTITSTHASGALTIVFESDGSAANDGWEATVTCAPPPTCPTPNMLTATDITAVSANLGWTANGTTTWNIEWGEYGFTQGMGTTIMGTTTNPHNLSDLSPITNYQFYVQADCGGGDTSAWFGPFAFTTECAAFNIPYDENFDSTATGSSSNPTIPNCWSFIDSGFGFGYVSSTGANSFYMGNSSDSSGDYILVSPFTTNLSSGNNRIRFDVDGSTGQELIVGTMSDATDPTTFTDIETITLATSNYENYIVNIPAGSDNFVALKHGQTGTYDSYYFDNIIVEERPACLEVADIAVDNITDVTAEISWTVSGSNEMAWEYMVQAPGTGIPTGNGMATSTNPATAMGLTAETDYEVYVRSNCGGGDYGVWIGPVNFTTACGALSNYVDVDMDANPPNDCWSESGSGEIADGPSSTSSSSDWEGDRAFTDSDNNVINGNHINLYDNVDREWLISPLVDGSNFNNAMDQVKVTVAVTEYQSSGTSSPTDTENMGSDDYVTFLVSRDGGPWQTITTWNKDNQPPATGVDFTFPLFGENDILQFAFFASDGTVNDSEDFDFHVGNFIIEMDDPLGTIDLTKNSKILVYPNPTSDVLNIKTDKEIKNIKIFTANGKKVMDSISSRKLDVSNLTLGVYFVQITTTDGLVQKSRFIKK